MFRTAIGLWLGWQSNPHGRPCMRFLFVGPEICLRSGPFNPSAIGFLQIPPRGGHPCLWLTLPTVGRVRDFHPIERAPVGRTKKGATAKNLTLLQLLYTF